MKSFKLRTLSLNSDATRYHDDPPVTALLLRNTFLVFRLAILALLTNFAFLTLIFASWNIHATQSVGFPAPSTSIFIIFESCMVFFCVAFALATSIRPNSRTSRTMLECGWVAVLSMFQMGGAISTVINGPAFACHATSDWDVCASASLLVPTTWLSTFIPLAYFLILFISIMTHKSLYPDIWNRPVHSIQWFERGQEGSSNEKAMKKFFGGSSAKDQDPYADYYEDIEGTAGRKKQYRIRDSVEEAVPWASSQVRRGIDHPFSRQPGQNSNRSSPTLATNISLPSLPAPSAKSGSRFTEKFRDSFVAPREDSSAPFAKLYHAHKTSFPVSVVDHDQPIPLPHLSEWIRADATLNDNSRYPASP